ncbi:MAG: ATP-dependent helicase [Vicinamibacteria bacterium]
MSLNAADRFRPAYLDAAEDLRGNPGQWQAYESRGHCVILAGPGSGKTKTLTIKMARMVHEDVKPPRGIACITYNSECARELMHRLERLGIGQAPNVFVGTVHSFCLRHVLMPYARLGGLALPRALAVASGREQEVLFEQALGEEIGADERPSSWKARVDEYRRTHLDRDDPAWLEHPQLASLIERYEAKLRAKELIDFDDMIFGGLALVEKHEWVRRAIRARFPILVVDEYQDLGVPLHRLVMSLCFGSGVRLLAVGDPDQSIYGFAGARPALLRELAGRDDVEAVQLRFNYRSGKTIVAAAEAALGEPRGYEARGSSIGTVDFYECPAGLEEQADRICREIIPEALRRRPGCVLGDIAVLYIDRNDGEVIARKVAEHGMKAVRLDRGAPYPKTPLTRWLEDCARWCARGWRDGDPRLSAITGTWLGFNQRVRPEQGRELLKREIVRFLFGHRRGEQELGDWLHDLEAGCLKRCLDAEPTLRDERETYAQLVRACRKGGALSGMTVGGLGGLAGASDHLNLITLHSAKGLEFDVVIIMGLEQGRLPHWSVSAGGKWEPRQLFYVGLTRARHEVHMTYSGWTENRFGRRFSRGPSEFVLEVRRRLAEVEGR